MLNPALYLVVFYVVFQLVLERGHPVLPDLPAVAACSAWNLFSASLAGATGVDRRQRAPREEGVVPARDPARWRRSAPPSCTSSCRRSCCVVALVVVPVRRRPGATCWLVVPGARSRCCCSPSALGILLAAVNVYVRDTQHLLELALLAWFWMTPIVYQYGLLADEARASTAGRRAHCCSTRSTPIVLASSGRSTASHRAPTAVSAILPDESSARGTSATSAIVGVVAVGRCSCSPCGLRPARGQLRRGALSWRAAIEVDGVSKRFRLYHRAPLVAEGAGHPLRPARAAEEFWALARHRLRDRARARPSACSATTARASRRC